MSARIVSLACTVMLASIGMTAIGLGSLANTTAQVSDSLVLLALVIALINGILRGDRGREKGSKVSSPLENQTSQADSSTE